MFKKKLPATEAIALVFTIPQRVHECPGADGIKQIPSTSAIILDFTEPQRVDNCPRADGV